jgi:hypothetical protein
MRTFVACLLLLLVLFAPGTLMGQTTDPNPLPLYSTIFGAGATYGQQDGTLPLTGNLFLANRLTSADNFTSPIYEYTIIDFQPMIIELENGSKRLQFLTVTTTGLAPFSRNIGPGVLWLVGTVGGAAGGNVAGLALSGRAVYTFPFCKKKGILGLANIGYVKTNAGGATATVFGLGVGWGKK